MTTAVLGLGANLGDPDDPAAAIKAALHALDADEEQPTTLMGVAGLWRSAPIGGPLQPDFHNTVALVETDLGSLDLLRIVQQIEEDAGRVREVRWGPRTLDIDILVFDEERRDDPTLTLPHPRAHQRAFVLNPWAELEPERVLVTTQGVAATVRRWAETCSTQELTRVASGGWWR